MKNLLNKLLAVFGLEVVNPITKSDLEPLHKALAELRASQERTLKKLNL